MQGNQFRGVFATRIPVRRVRLDEPVLGVPIEAMGLAITFAGTIFSGWLTWLQLVDIEAICQWCLGSAAVTALLFINELLNVGRIWGQDDQFSVESDVLSQPGRG